MVTREVTVSEQPMALAIESGNPRMVVQRAREIAAVLKELVSLKPRPILINGEQYLEFEDWQTLGQFTAYAVRTQDAVPVEINGVQGAKARAELIDTRTGLVVGGAEAYCMRDEERWSTRPKYDFKDNEKIKVGDEPVPWFQLASMAQTRAGAKAYRNRLAWIAVLAGYKPTPAEEMTGNESTKIDPSSKYFCQAHKTEWFKRGRMTGFAHPIDGSNEWCRMPAAPVVDAKPAPATVQESRGSAQPVQGDAPATEAQWKEIKAINEQMNWTIKEACDFVGATKASQVTQAQAIDILIAWRQAAAKAGPTAKGPDDPNYIPELDNLA